MPKFFCSAILVSLYASVAHGCSPCLVTESRLKSICLGYEQSENVYVARTVNATCNCYTGTGTAPGMLGNLSCITGSQLSATTDHVLSLSTSTVAVANTTGCRFDYYSLIPCTDVLKKFEPTECSFEGQVFTECASLCPATCSNHQFPSLCPEVCVRGCACPSDMVLDEEQRKCVTPSNCPSKECSIIGQSIASCGSVCPTTCFNYSNTIACPEVCAVNVCQCATGETVDPIAGRCVEPSQCSNICPIEGQSFTTCASACPITCDNLDQQNATCVSVCREGCECPSGTVIDVGSGRCVEPDQCKREPEMIATNVTADGSCQPRLVCPYNAPDDRYNPCQYVVEVAEVFKGNLKVGDRFTSSGRDLVTSCGSPYNILSIGGKYLLGIGGAFCGSAYFSDWITYSEFSDAERQVLFGLRDNGVCNSAAVKYSFVTNFFVIIMLLAVISISLY